MSHWQSGMDREEGVFREILERSSDAILLTDEQGIVVEWNRAAEQMTGYPASEIVGRFCWDAQFVLVPSTRRIPEFAKHLETLMSAALVTGQGAWLGQVVEGVLETKDGESRVFQQVGHAIPSGQRFVLCAVTRDITEQRRAEADLRTSEQAALAFQEKLKVLHEVGMDLSRAADLDDLYRSTIELGCGRLGFDRIGLWLVSEDRSRLLGTYGMSRDGLLVDERDQERLIDVHPHREVLRNPTRTVVHMASMPHWHLWASLWDGDRCIGWFSADNRVRFEPLASYQPELLSLYAATVAHWIAQKRAENALQQSQERFIKLNEELEQRVARRTEQLEEANRELEAFAYSVSHDLRAPLRAVDGFARILLQEYAPQLVPEAQRYLGIVRQNAQHMGDLIDGLLMFSRLGRQDLRVEEIETGELVRQVVKELKTEVGDRQVEFVVGDLPPCRADPLLLRQVFVNLVSNAVKFISEREIARIEIGLQAIDGEEVYYVRDNGVGFDIKYADRLFGVFQRLHSAYEGTGVGLAIVQRILHRHGGRIWAEAAVDEGATFYLTLS